MLKLFGDDDVAYYDLRNSAARRRIADRIPTSPALTYPPSTRRSDASSDGVRLGAEQTRAHAPPQLQAMLLSYLGWVLHDASRLETLLGNFDPCWAPSASRPSPVDMKWLSG